MGVWWLKRGKESVEFAFGIDSFGIRAGNQLPIGSIVVPFWDYLIGFYT